MSNEALRANIEAEVAANTILQCTVRERRTLRCARFTMETIKFFNHFGYPFEVINILENDFKRAELLACDGLGHPAEGLHRRRRATVTPTSSSRWPKAGRWRSVLKEAFSGKAKPAPIIHLH